MFMISCARCTSRFFCRSLLPARLRTRPGAGDPVSNGFAGRRFRLGLPGIPSHCVHLFIAVRAFPWAVPQPELPFRELRWIEYLFRFRILAFLVGTKNRARQIVKWVWSTIVGSAVFAATLPAQVILKPLNRQSQVSFGDLAILGSLGVVGSYTRLPGKVRSICPGSDSHLPSSQSPSPDDWAYQNGW
jgi:hypothetical protein